MNKNKAAKQIEESLEKAPRQSRKSSSSNKPVVLVTGSAGLIGSKLVEALSSDYEMVGMDVKRPRQLPAGADFVKCDLTRNESVEKALKTVRDRHGDHLASVVHLAAYYDFSGEPSEMYDRLTVQGTLRLLKELKAFQVEQFVFSSTILVMEPSKENELLTESSPLEDEPWDYPRSKIQTENLLRRERGDIPTVILRIAGVYDDLGHAVPIAQQISRIYEKKLESYFFPGDAGHGQAFVHMDDLIDCFRKVIERRRQLNEMDVFLVAEPEVMSYKELQDQIGTLLHREEWTTIWIPKLMAKMGAWAKGLTSDEKATFIKPWMIDLADNHYPVAIRHAQEKLGWQPQYRLRDTLSRIIGHLKNEPVRWYRANKLPLPKDLKKRAKDEQAA